MVSSAMTVKEEEDGKSLSVLPTGNGISLQICSVQSNDQFTSGDDYSPKVRKPYTITKQRERWTEEEHKKFVEALKLHGRAWRKIEEHVGTKSAVQIRSHAQKFFFKVARDPNGSNMNSEEPIEIPPPRPKRKPVHPYPRKLVNQLNKENFMVEATTLPASPNCSLSDQENQSPKSVLSSFDSDNLGSSDSNTPNGSVSPVSSASGMHSGFLVRSQSNLSPEENNSPPLGVKKSYSPPMLTENPMKMELFPEDNVYEERCSTEGESMRSLKLFGQIVVVADSQKSSSLTRGDLLPSDVPECKPVKPVPLNVAINSSTGNNVHLPSHLSHGSHGAFNLMHFQNENSNNGALGSPTPVTCWPYYGVLPSPFVSFDKQESTGKECLDSNAGKGQEQEVEEVSLTGSNTGSVNVEEESCQCSAGNDEKEPFSVFKLKRSSTSAFCELKASRGLCEKGFVPYKRCTSERYTQSSTMTGGEERRGKRKGFAFAYRGPLEQSLDGFSVICYKGFKSKSRLMN